MRKANGTGDTTLNCLGWQGRPRKMKLVFPVRARVAVAFRLSFSQLIHGSNRRQDDREPRMVSLAGLVKQREETRGLGKRKFLR